MVYVLNSPILTNFGVYRYKEISIVEAQKILKENSFVSAIGHESTAVFLSELLQSDIKANRVSITMQQGDKAIIFQLLTRLKEGQILSINELSNKDYRLGLLEKLE
jgi:hypothetical protein